MGEEAFGELGGGADDVLAVVQDEQQAAVRAVLDEEGGRVLGRGLLAGDEGVLAQAERAEDGARDGGGVVEAGQLDQPAGLGLIGGRVLGEAGLSGAAGAGEGDEAEVGEVAGEGGEFGLAADEGGEAGAEVAARVWGVEVGGGFRRGAGAAAGAGAGWRSSACRARSSGPGSVPRVSARRARVRS
ncbi:hypothetical protein M4D82_17965 [Streptomyces sp. RerS4]|nr:hypothetical protein [Streptomyces sp. RerS4]UQX02166.1 hypothetical protein M4D82_17965 [Streptomyces sp. RerS4]